MPARLFIGCLWFWILAQIGCNLLQGVAMTSEIPSALGTSDLGNTSITTSSDTSGTPAQYVSLNTGFFSAVGKIFWFDYPAIYQNDDGNRDEIRSLIQYFLIAVGIVMWVSLAIVIRQMFPA